MTYDGQKRNVQFYNSATVDVDPSELVYVVIAATPTMLDEIGGLTFASGSRFPSIEQSPDVFRFNETTRQELIHVGLELMGATELEFDTIITTSSDSSFHSSWSQGITDKGHWYLHLQIPTIIGETGPQGIQGIQGIQGVKGDKGDKGDTGNTGSAGSNGTNGTNGVDGRTVLNGSGVPSNSIGSNNDFYINTSNWTIYGPKTAGVWGSATSIVGPTGSQGIQGIQGTQGIQGPTGATGATGPAGPANDIPVRTDTNNDLKRCSIATFLASSMRTAWQNEVTRNDSDVANISSGTANLVTLASVFLGPEIVIGAGIATALVSLVNKVFAARAAGLGDSFDSTYQDKIASDLYCIMDTSGTFDATVKANWVSAIRTHSESVTPYVADFIETMPIEIQQWLVYKAPLLVSNACASYACPGSILLLNGSDRHSNFTVTYGSYNSTNDRFEGQLFGGINPEFGLTLNLGRTVNITRIKAKFIHQSVSGNPGFGSLNDEVGIYSANSPARSGSYYGPAYVFQQYNEAGVLRDVTLDTGTINVNVSTIIFDGFARGVPSSGAKAYLYSVELFFSGVAPF